ncbi:MAG TPA: GNA1162 family protein [Smithella sp.]|nr:GNA1162 family protein [Smithella sp.]
MKFYRLNLLWIFMFFMICGCFGHSPQIGGDDHDKINAKIIAVMPVENKNPDGNTSRLFRKRLLDELFFKGYPKLSLETIDKKMDSLKIDGDNKNATATAPQKLNDLEGADAALYCTLTEDSKSKILYTPITISARCELRSAQTGEVLWHAQSESTERNFDFTKGLEKASHDNLEIVIDEVVSNILKTLPDGPNLRG